MNKRLLRLARFLDRLGTRLEQFADVMAIVVTVALTVCAFGAAFVWMCR